MNMCSYLPSSHSNSKYSDFQQKISRFYSMLANHHVYYRLARLAGTFKIIGIDFQCRYHQKDIKLYDVLDPFHLQRVNKLYRKCKPLRIIQQKEHLLIWNSKTNQNLNIYLHNYQTETIIFLATKHEKTITACSYLNFPIQKIHLNSKRW